MRVFITGAGGFIGSWLVRRALREGADVVAVARSGVLSPIPGENEPSPFVANRLRVVDCDIRDAAALARAMDGATHVFHLAGLAKPWARDPRDFYRVNVDGARNVFDAARQVGAERIVYTSSAVTLGPTLPGQIHSESTPRITDESFHDYESTKREAEALALARAAQGEPIVVVLPTRVYGPGLLTLSNALPALIDDYLSGRMPIVLNAGKNVGNYAYVHDVVDGHWRAMTHGRVGERYLLGGENVSLLALTDMIDRLSGRKHLRINIGTLAPLAFAHLSVLVARIFGIEPKITPGFVRMYLADGAYDSSKATGELGYQPTSFDEGLRVTFDWLGKVKPSKDHMRLARQHTTEEKIEPKR